MVLNSNNFEQFIKSPPISILPAFRNIPVKSQVKVIVVGIINVVSHQCIALSLSQIVL